MLVERVGPRRLLGACSARRQGRGQGKKSSSHEWLRERLVGPASQRMRTGGNRSAEKPRRAEREGEEPRARDGPGAFTPGGNPDRLVEHRAGRRVAEHRNAGAVAAGGSTQVTALLVAGRMLRRVAPVMPGVTGSGATARRAGERHGRRHRGKGDEQQCRDKAAKRGAGADHQEAVNFRA